MSRPGCAVNVHASSASTDPKRLLAISNLIAVRQRVDAIVPSVRETEPLEPPIDAPTDLFAAPAAQPAQIQELVVYPHARRRLVLRACTRTVSAPPFQLAPRASEPPAGIELNEPEDGPHRSRLSRAVRTEETGEPPRLRRERARVEREHGPEALTRHIELEHGFPPHPSIPRTPNRQQGTRSARGGCAPRALWGPTRWRRGLRGRGSGGWDFRLYGVAGAAAMM